MITRMIRKMDIFGQPINLNLDLRSKYQTFLGGFVSMFIVLLLIGYSVNEIIGYTIQRGIQITQETRFNYDPDVLVLNNKNFIFAIRVEQESFYQFPQFDIQVRQHQNKKEVSMELQQCTFQQFISVLNSSQVLDFLQANQVDTWLCPKSEFSIELEGTQFCMQSYFEGKAAQFSSLMIEIGECNQRSSWGSECQTRTQKDSYKLQMITKNTFINPFNNEFVAEDYLDNSMSLYFQPGDLQRIDYQFHKHITKDYQGQIKIEGLLDEQEWNIFSTNSFKQIYEGKNNLIWSRIVFMRSNFSTNYNREYQTVTDLLSKIGGLSQSVISIVGSIIGENDQGTKGSGLVDPLHYSVQLHQETTQPLKKKRKVVDKTNIIKQPEEDSMDEDPQFKERVLRVVEEQKQIMDKYQFKSRKHFLLSTFQQTILMKQSIQLNLKYFFQKLFCKKSDPKEDPRLYVLQKALTSVRQELDVFSILNRIHQLEKLKKILLDRDQLILFNYSPKPVIAVNEKDKETDFLHYSKQQSLKQMTLVDIAEDIKKKLKSTYITKEHLSIENVFNSYKAIAAKNRKSNRYYYKINRKLKQFLGDQVKAIFKASKLLKFPEDDQIPEMGVDDIMSVGGETVAQYPLNIENLNYIQFQFNQALRLGKYIYYIENSLLRKVSFIENNCSDSVIVQAEVSMICTDGKLIYSLLQNGDIYQIEQPPRLLKSGNNYKWISPIAAIDQSHRGFIWKTNKQIYSHCKHISSYQDRITLITIGGKIFNVVADKTIAIPQLNGLKLNTYFKKSLLFSFGGVAITESGEFYLFNQKMIRVKIKDIKDIFSTDKYIFAIQNNHTILQYSIEDIQSHQFFTNQQIFQKMHYCNDVEFKCKQKQFQNISILQSEYSCSSFAYIKENKILDTSLNLTDKTNQVQNKSNSILIMKQSLFDDWDCKKKILDSRRSTTIDKQPQTECINEGSTLTLAQKLATIRESLNFEKPIPIQIEKDKKDRNRQQSLIQLHQVQIEDLPQNPTPIKLDNLLNKIHVNKPEKPIDQLLLIQNKQELQDSLPTFQNDNQFTNNNDTLNNKKKSKQNNCTSRSNRRQDSMSAQSGIEFQNNSGFIQQQDSFVDILDNDSIKKDLPLQLQPFDKSNKYKKNTLDTIQSYDNEQDPKTTNRLSNKKDQVLQLSNRSPNKKTIRDPLLTERSSTKRNIEQAKQDLETLVNMINKQKENTEISKSNSIVHVKQKSSIRMISPPIQVGSSLTRPESKITPLKNRRASLISESSQQESFKMPQRISKQNISSKLNTQQSFNSSSQHSQFQFDSQNFRQLNTLQDQESQLDLKSAKTIYDQSLTQQMKKLDQLKGLKKVQCSSQVNILRNNSLNKKSSIIVNTQQKQCKQNLRKQEAILKKLFFRLDVRLKLQQLEFVNNLKCLL
ncbi:unnamed protein product [Paramecium pentaurelia]|uniref:Transmembrane protein n=1 Tax=Paramecium pentaurelia TaxID=43138 RepID=A0A8S1XL18_9CILI|nr:unnamed protein product [Paramecium pentaurelia]